MEEIRQPAARRDFEEARRRAALQQALAALRGESSELLSFDEVRTQLRATGASDQGLQEIRLDDIVGSVGRYRDFTRSFLPRHAGAEARWARVKEIVEREGMRPITVYKIGQAYFVNDGNHRVSIARQRGDETIQAYVTEIKSRVPLKPDDSPEAIICKARYADFLEKTNLDKLRPTADLLMTLAGYYSVLEQQIEVEHHLLQLDPTREEVPYSEAVGRWYDRVYLPLVGLIRQLGLPLRFPERTEADLFVMLTQHRAELRKDLDWRVDMAAAAEDLMRQEAPAVAQVGGRVLEAITPAALEAGPGTGQWRKQRLAHRPGAGLFADILVGGRGLEADLNMVRHAARIGRRESSRLLAVRIVDSEAERNSEPVKAMRREFRRYIREMNLRGELTVEVGDAASIIVQRAAWVDLVALSLTRHTGPPTATGYGTRFRTILQRSPRPVLVVPEGADSAMDRGLLAYDGSPKADEALFGAAYMAEAWGMDLVVLSAGGDQAARALERAREYLEEKQIRAEYVQRPGPALEAILETAESHGRNFLIMGGFGFRPLFQALLGSTVDGVLERFEQPIFICR
jgi:nucleotide-binding universal stress UspA family protein